MRDQDNSIGVTADEKTNSNSTACPSKNSWFAHEKLDTISKRKVSKRYQKAKKNRKDNLFPSRKDFLIIYPFQQKKARKSMKSTKT